MSEIVFVFGAGASSEAGAPLMKDFLDEAYELHKLHANPNFELVFKAFDALKAAAAYAVLDFENLESVFAAFEMAKLLGKLGNLSSEELNRLPSAMRYVIVSTLEASIRFPADRHSVHPPASYDQFVSMIKDVRNYQKRISVITFNYDLCLDYAFYAHSVDVNYCLNSARNDSTLPYMKLHGSLDWIRCPGCSQIVPWTIRGFLRGRSWNLHEDGQKVGFNLAANLFHFNHCPGQSSSESIIVPPTWNKGHHHEQLVSVWQGAARELSDAERIFIIGYSLPDADQFFRNLYAIGITGAPRIKEIRVFNPDQNVHEKFRVLLGPLAEKRFYPSSEPFNSAVELIKRSLIKDSSN